MKKSVLQDYFDDISPKKKQKQMKSSGRISFYDTEDFNLSNIKVKNYGNKKSKRFV